MLRTKTRFETVEAAHGWARTVFARSVGRLSVDELAALRLYKGQGYREINDVLRAGALNSHPWRDQIRLIEQAIGRSRLPIGVTVYRALQHGVIADAHSRGVPIGIQLKGFLSTSLVESEALEYYEHEAGGVLLEIGAPCHQPPLAASHRRRNPEIHRGDLPMSVKREDRPDYFLSREDDVVLNPSTDGSASGGRSGHLGDIGIRELPGAILIVIVVALVLAAFYFGFRMGRVSAAQHSATQSAIPR